MKGAECFKGLLHTKKSDSTQKKSDRECNAMPCYAYALLCDSFSVSYGAPFSFVSEVASSYVALMKSKEVGSLPYGSHLSSISISLGTAGRGMGGGSWACNIVSADKKRNSLE